MKRFAGCLISAVLFVSITAASAVAQQQPVNSSITFGGQYQPFAAVHGASTLPAPVVGTVISFARNKLALDLPDGAVRTFFISPAGRGGDELLIKGQRLAVTVDSNGNALFVRPADQTVTATVETVTKDGITLKLKSGRTMKLPSSALTSLHGSVRPGMRLTFTTHDGGYTSSITSSNG